MLDIHAIIQDHFSVLSRQVSMPILARKVGREGLAELLGKLNLNRGVEVGVHLGKYSQTLCRHNENIELTAIDPWVDRKGKRTQKYNEFLEHAATRLKDYNVKILRATSMDAVRNFADRSLDFAYIDGNHSFDFVVPDIIFWSYKVKSGGIIGCHDYTHFRNCHVMEAVNAYTHCHHIIPWYVTEEKSPTAFWVNP